VHREEIYERIKREQQSDVSDTPKARSTRRSEIATKEM